MRKASAMAMISGMSGLNFNRVINKHLPEPKKKGSMTKFDDERILNAEQKRKCRNTKRLVNSKCANKRIRVGVRV